MSRAFQSTLLFSSFLFFSRIGGIFNKSSRFLLRFFERLTLLSHFRLQSEKKRLEKESEKERRRRNKTKRRKKNSLGSYAVAAALCAMPSRADVDWASRASWSAQFDEACACQRLDDELEKVKKRIARRVLFPSVS